MHFLPIIAYAYFFFPDSLYSSAADFGNREHFFRGNNSLFV